MNHKINVLTPEPITLVDDDSLSSTRDDDAARSRSNSSAVNQNFNFQKAIVSDCTIVNGENGAKFAVWKVTLFLQPSSENVTYYPRIISYMRYSDFYNFRELLIRRCKETQGPVIDIPKLPPRIKWYESWRYQDVNLNKIWLAKRRQGLDYFLNHILLNNAIVTVAKDLIISFLESRHANSPQDKIGV